MVFIVSGAVQVGEVALVKAVQVYAFQRDMVFRLASDCSRGVPGSAIFLSHAQFPRHSNSNGEDQNGDGALMASGPTVFYIKVSLVVGRYQHRVI